MGGSGWRRMLPRVDTEPLQPALTNVLILVHKAIPVLVDVLQRFLGSKGETHKMATCLKQVQGSYCPLCLA